MTPPGAAHKSEFQRVVDAVQAAIGTGKEPGTSGHVDYRLRSALFHCLLNDDEYVIAIIPTDMPPLTPRE